MPTFQSNPDDRCANERCGHSRLMHLSPACNLCGCHAFVEPAPQPAPSGDEAKVRETLNKHGVPELGMITGAQGHCLDCRAVIGAGFDCRLCSAFRLGKADGAREEREACEKLARGHTFANRIADAIARRGSEGT